VLKIKNFHAHCQILLRRSGTSLSPAGRPGKRGEELYTSFPTSGQTPGPLVLSLSIFLP
jgi:hypothetical protein